jgi:predicted amidohydrolase YtcJ
VTHRYTLLVGGTVISGRDEPDASAIAWAEDTVIAIGSDADVAGISRGDSHRFDLAGAHVLPLGDGPEARWPTAATLEIGGRADLAVVRDDPRRIDAPEVRQLRAKALIRGGRVVAGRLPGRPSDG